MKFSQALNGSIGRKIVMSLTGLFLISFLVVHAIVNGLIFYNDGGATFNIGAHFMGTNPMIRTLEIVLILSFLVHIYQGISLWKRNRAARPQRYVYKNSKRQGPWYSRSMTLLGTLILLFLVVHTSNFWIPNRVHQFQYGKELPLYEMMIEKFQYPIEVLIYLLGCFSLFWHLLHGFRSALTTLGITHTKWDPPIRVLCVGFSIVIPAFLALMPLAIYFKWIQ